MRLSHGKKARRDSHVELGFEVLIRCDLAFDHKAKALLADRFLAEAMWANRLVCGGGAFGGDEGNELRVVVVKEYQDASCTDRDRGRIERWLAAQAGIARFRIGPLVPAETEGYRLDRPPLPRPPGKRALDRAVWFREEAIALYQRAAAVLGRPEIQEAGRNLERSVELVHAAVEEVGGALFRKLGIPPLRAGEGTSFVDVAQDAIMPGLFDPRRKLQAALRDVTSGLDRGGTSVIDIPDIHAVEQKLVGGSRDVIDELRKLVSARTRSPLEEQIVLAAERHRERERQGSNKRKQPDWPRERVAVFMAERSVRETAVLGENYVERTIISQRLAKACGADVLSVEVPVFIRKGDDKGHLDLHGSRWVAAHPALVWISVPGTAWKAPVLAAVVPTARCPVPRVGQDWLQDAVHRPHEHPDEDEPR